MRSVTIRNFEISVSTLLGIALLVLVLIVGSVWASEQTKSQELSCAAGPPLQVSPPDTAAAQSSQQELKSLDTTTRDLFRSNRDLKKKHKADTENKVQQLAKARKNIMLDQMRKNPDKALMQVLSDSERASAQSLTQGCVETPATIEGSLEVVHTDFINHTTAETYVLKTKNQERLTVHPAKQSKVHLSSGEQLQLKGYRLDNDVVFDASSQDSVKVVSKPALPWGTGRAEAAAADTMGPQQTIVLMVYFQNTSQPALTKASVDNTIFTQMNNYYQETSYGQMSVVGTSVNWMQIPMNQTCDINTGTDNVQNAAIAAADPTVNFANYSRIIIVANFGGFACGWSGVGTVGKTFVSTADGRINASVSWVDASSVGAETHEFGHNLGLDHAEFYNCGSVTFSFSGCTLDEYGDQYTPMGSGSTAHMNAPEKDFLGWLGTTHTQTVTTNGNYTIEPLETTPSGLKTIRIQRSNGGDFGYMYSYYEYRTATGSDSGLNANVLSGALLHNFTDSYTLLLDATPPGDKNTPAMPVGGSFTDPATASKVTLTAKTASSLTFNVVLGKTDFSTPTISITSPANNATVSGTTTVTATASAPSGIKQIDFYLDNAASPSFTGTTAPFNYVIDTTTLTDGSHTINAVATDKSGEAYAVPGNKSGYASVSIITSNDAIPPTVSITAPANGSTVNGSAVVVNASASDNVGVSKVEFYVDGVMKLTDTTSPYSYTWDSTTVANGSHTIMAKAYDVAGNVGTSSVSATVNNPINDTLASNQVLTAGNFLKSINSQFVAVMQGDGNFVAYNAVGIPTWNSGTPGNAGSIVAMQNDGNLVVYNAGGKPLWSSGTSGNTSSRLVMQNDGNLVVYNAGGKPIWSSMTGKIATVSDTLTSGQILTSGNFLKSINGQFIAAMQNDGNLVVYNAAGKPLWSSGTTANPGSLVAMQNDGNLVVYNGTGKPTWSSITGKL